MIRAIVTSNNPLIRGRIKSLLEASGGIKVVGEASTGGEAVQLAGEHQPDVVLCDIRITVMDGIEAVGRLHKTTKVIMLTYAEDQQLVAGAIRAGASGHLVLGRFTPEDLESAVKQVAAGQGVLSSAAVNMVFDALRRDPEDLHQDGPLSLTEREREIVSLLAKGKSNPDIATELFITDKTVKNHINHIYAKLGVTNRAEAIALWLGVTETRGCPERGIRT